MTLLKKPIILLIIIVFIATLIRTIFLGSVPPSLNWDEVSLGYNANSILQTGRDEYGAFFPVVLRSFDDYKPALYTYLDIPFVGLLGLTEIAVRLPSVTAGISAVFLVYFLVSQIFGKEVEINGRKIRGSTIALVASLALAISPWHIQFSRIAFESNVGLTLNITAFLLFLKGLKKALLLPLSFISAALAVNVYQSDRVFSPLLMLALVCIFYREILKIKKWFLISVACAFIIVLPLALFILTNDNALLRARGVSVFSEQSLVKNSSEKLLHDEQTGNYFGKILDNRRIEYGKAVVAGYISHFDLNWLFITGDLARHHAPFMGLLYLFELPLLLVGIYVFTFLKFDKRNKLAFLVYFLLVPIPASITSGVPHAVRTLNFEWTFETLIALGVVSSIVFVLSIRDKRTRFTLQIFSILFLLLSLLNIIYYFNQYFVQMNFYNAKDWLYGYKEAVLFVKENNYDNKKIIVENEVPFDQSYMFFLFYLNVDPSYYQKTGGTNSGGFKEKHKGFYNYSFQPVKDVKGDGKTIVIGKPSDIDGSSTVLKRIMYPDGTAAITIGIK